MTTPIDYEKYMPRGYTIVRTADWVLTDPEIGTNIPVKATGPVDIYVTWEGETTIVLVLVTPGGVRRTLASGKKSIRYTLGARNGDMVTITGDVQAFPESDSHLRGTIKILPTANLY